MKLNRPHGTLIDRDALIDKLRKMSDSKDSFIRTAAENMISILMDEPEVVPYEDTFDLRDLHLE